jgi:hypothetical protein
MKGAEMVTFGETVATTVQGRRSRENGAELADTEDVIGSVLKYARF